jgi:hypothetical protein
VNGGVPALGDAPVFLRVFTLLRHRLQHPCEREEDTPLPQQRIDRLRAIPGDVMPGEEVSLGRDVQELLTPYGFLDAPRRRAPR